MLNQSQIRAISHKEGPAMVLAGAGSGKTTVIIHRVRNLIVHEGVPPEKIMVVTFTRAAALHMRERFLELLSGVHDFCGGCPVTFGTFHSIYFGILRRSCNYKSDDIVTDRMKYDFLKEIIIRLKLEVYSMQDFIAGVSSEISKVKGNLWNACEYRSGYCKSETFQKIFAEYEKTLAAEHKIDFEDMLLKCRELLLENEDILQQWQGRFSYILIDEFQDICRVQYEIIKLLAAPENNLFIVGDDDQSIYGFRGASPQIMFRFQKDYPRAEEILLNINYRSTPEIVALSANLIGHNHNRFAKEILAAKEKGTPPDIRQFRNQGEELEYLCGQIRQYEQKGIRQQDMVILVRSNSQIVGIRDFLQNEMIPTKNGGRKNTVYQGMVARDVIAYIKAALCGGSVPVRENEGLVWILNKPSRFISRQMIGQGDMTLEGLKHVYHHNGEILSNIEQLQFHLQMIGRLNPYAAVTYIRNGTGYEKYLQQYALEHHVKFAGLIKQLDRIQREAAGFVTLKEWIAHIETQNAGSEPVQKTESKVATDGKCESTAACRNVTEEAQGVRVMTMHSAKGLEYRVVFIVDANQGIVPSSRAVREKDLQEERRLFYVAVTRAAEFLHIYGVRESLGCAVEMSVFVQECVTQSREESF